MMAAVVKSTKCTSLGGRIAFHPRVLTAALRAWLTPSMHCELQCSPPMALLATPGGSNSLERHPGC
jgi:hypothetical protein